MWRNFNPSVYPYVRGELWVDTTGAKFWVARATESVYAYVDGERAQLASGRSYLPFDNSYTDFWSWDETSNRNAGSHEIPPSQIFDLVKDYGAVGDNSPTNASRNTDALSALLADSAVGVGRVPAGSFYVDGTLSSSVNGVSLIGDGRQSSKILCNSGPVMNLSGSHIRMEGLAVQSLSGGSHVFVTDPGKTVALSHFVDCNFTQNNPSLSVWYFNDTGGLGGGFFDNHWEDIFWGHVITATVPGFFVYSNGNNVFSANHFTASRWNRSGNYAWSITCDKSSSYNYNNVWSEINFEVCDGGGILLHSGINNSIENVGFFDNGTITKDLIVIGRNSGLSISRGNRVKGYHRSGGTLSSGVVDIRVESGSNGQDTVVDTVTGPPAAGITVDLGSGSVLIGNSSQTVISSLQRNTVLVGGVTGITTPRLATAGYTNTELNSASNAVNTSNKVEGTMVWNSTVHKPVYARGSAATDIWMFADGTTANTPI